MTRSRPSTSRMTTLCWASHSSQERKQNYLLEDLTRIIHSLSEPAVVCLVFEPDEGLSLCQILQQRSTTETWTPCTFSQNNTLLYSNNKDKYLESYSSIIVSLYGLETSKVLRTEAKTGCDGMLLSVVVLLIMVPFGAPADPDNVALSREVWVGSLQLRPATVNILVTCHTRAPCSWLDAASSPPGSGNTSFDCVRVICTLSTSSLLCT